MLEPNNPDLTTQLNHALREVERLTSAVNAQPKELSAKKRNRYITRDCFNTIKYDGQAQMLREGWIVVDLGNTREAE